MLYVFVLTGRFSVSQLSIVSVIFTCSMRLKKALKYDKKMPGESEKAWGVCRTGIPGEGGI